MEQVTAPPDRGRASTSATSDDAAAPDAPAAVGSVVELASTIESTVASAVASAASAAAVRVIPPVVPASTVASTLAGIGAGNVAASILGSRRQMERMFASAAAGRGTITESGTHKWRSSAGREFMRFPQHSSCAVLFEPCGSATWAF